jgi:hypothetical protein
MRIFAALLVAAAAAFPAAAELEPSAKEVLAGPDFALPSREHDVAVVIGIEDYHDIAAKSEFSADDARLVKNYLVSLGFRETNIQLLVNGDASNAGFNKTMRHWLPDHVKPDSTVVFYYSGHGAPDVTTNPAKPEAYLVPYDGDPNYLSDTGYKVENLYDSLGKLKAAKVVVVLDSCFSGSGDRSVLAAGARALVNQFAPPVGAIAANMAVLTATKANQMSASDPAHKHGVLTYNFLKALRAGQTDLYAIYKAIKEPVEDEAKGARHIDQSPEYTSGSPAALGVFTLADAKAIADSRAERAAAAAAAEAAKKNGDADRLAKERADFEAQKKAAADQQAAAAQALRDENARLERERQQKAYNDQRQLDDERRRIEANKASAPAGTPAFVPPTF